MKLRKLKMWRLLMSILSRRQNGYQKLSVEYNLEQSSSCIMTSSTKIATQKNEASHADVVTFWTNAIQPTFRSRRGGVEEAQLKKDFKYLERVIYEEVLEQYFLL